MKVYGPLEIAGAEVLSSLPVTNLFEGRLVQVAGAFYYYAGGVWEGVATLSAGVLPPQSGQAGKWLTTDGNSAQWASELVDMLYPYPTKSGNAGKFLTTDGTNTFWDDTPGNLPAQTGNAGKYLTTDGSTTSWEEILRASIEAGAANQVLINNGAGALTSEAQLATSRGGFGEDVSAFSGYVRTSAPGNFEAGSIPEADIPSGIPATKISSGLVDNTTFDRLTTVGRFASTTKISGGNLSINADPTKFDLSAGTGSIIDASVTPATPTIFDASWSTFTAQTVTNLATADLTYILINSSNAIVQQTTYPTQTEQRQNVFIGRINHANRVTISFVDNIGTNTQSIGNQYADLVDAIGPFSIEGNSPATNGANLTFQKSAGSMFSRYYQYQSTPTNPHVVSLSAAAPVTFAYRTQLGGTTGNVTDIDPTNYDVGGVVTLVPGAASTATIQRVYLFPSNNVRIQYGQTTYSNLANALAAIQTESFVIASSIKGFAILIGYIVVQKNATDLTDTTRARILGAARFDTGSSGGSIATTTLQAAYLNSTIPQITLTATQGELRIVDASVPIGTDLLSVANNAGSTKYFRVDVQGVKGSNFSTPSAALATDANGAIVTTNVSATELDRLNGISSALVEVAGAQSITGQKTLTTPIIFGQASAPTYMAGTVWYDTTDNTMRYFNDSTGDSVNIGQEVNVKVRNTSGSTINPGEVVRITGAASGIPTVALAQANTFATAKGFAVVTEQILNNTNGYATISGLVKNLNLNTFADGDILYLSAGVAGGLTATPPTAGSYRVPIGTVASNSATTGRLIVQILNNRSIGLGTANQLLGMNAGATEQEYKTISGTTNQTTVTHGANSITIGLDPAALSSTGGVNLITYPSTATSWSETGSVFSTPATTSAGADLPLSGATPTAIQFVATGNGSEATTYNSFSVTTSAAMTGKLEVSFFMRPGTGFVSGEWTVSVYAGSTRQSLSGDSSGVFALTNQTGRITFSFDAVASTAYTLRFARTSGSGSATLNVCNVFFGIPFVSQTAAVSDRNAFTPTFSNVTVTDAGSYWRRVGSDIEITVQVAASADATGSVLWNMNGGLTGITPDTSKFGNRQAFGAGMALLGVNNYVISPQFNGTNYQCQFAISGTATVLDATNPAADGGFDNGDRLTFTVSYPVAEWALNGTVNLGQGAQVEYAYNTDVSATASVTASGFASGSSGVVVSSSWAVGTTYTRRITFQYPIQDSDIIELHPSRPEALLTDHKPATSDRPSR